MVVTPEQIDEGGAAFIAAFPTLADDFMPEFFIKVAEVILTAVDEMDDEP